MEKLYATHCEVKLSLGLGRHVVVSKICLLAWRCSARDGSHGEFCLIYKTLDLWENRRRDGDRLARCPNGGCVSDKAFFPVRDGGGFGGKSEAK